MQTLKQQQQETVVTLKEYIPRLIKGLTEIIGHFQAGEEVEGYTVLEQALEGYEWVLQAIELTNSLHVQPIGLGNVNQKISALLEAMENKDTLLITDIIEFEVMEELVQWKSTFEHVVND